MNSVLDLLSRTLTDPHATHQGLIKALAHARTLEDEARAQGDHLAGLRRTLADVSALTRNADAIAAARDHRTAAGRLVEHFETRLAGASSRDISGVRP